MGIPGSSPIGHNGRTCLFAPDRLRRRALRGEYNCIALCVSAAISLIAVLPQIGYASLRCAAAAIGSPATAAESAEITALWRDLAAPAADGSDGPLGCPVDLVATSDAPSGWSGLVQRFQRGWILIGRGSSAGFEVAAARGLGGWFVWWTAPSSNLGNLLMPVTTDGKGQSGILIGLTGTNKIPGGIPPAANATWSHGGFFRGTEVQATTLALWRCSASPCLLPPAISPATWAPVTPQPSPPVKGPIKSLDTWAGPFDIAAKFDVAGLTKPDAARFVDHVGAIFPDWLPCYTRTPASDSDPGEGTFSQAMVMMRGTNSCPLSGISPRSVVDQWLTQLSFPKDQKPGTDSHECSRHGDLDVALVGLMHLVREHQGQLSAGAIANVRNIVTPWGGAPRADAYITPDGTCYGFGVIETENHILMQETSRYLINAFLSADTTQNRDWLRRFLQQIARRDFYEYNALPYTRYSVKALYALHDYSPDPSVATAARGILDWVFAKESLSANFERDHRPYRRQPTPDRYADPRWWGGGTIASNAQATLFAGPFQHVHQDIDLELDKGKDEGGHEAFKDVLDYPALGAADENFAAEFGDAADTKYTLPAAVRGWLETRFTQDIANRVTYIQGIHHSSAVADDPALFLQPNRGAELISGNRNWTIIAGGNMVPPGFPPTPPGGGVWVALGVGVGVVVGAIIGGVVLSLVGWAALLEIAILGVLGGLGASWGSKAYAAKKQFDTLWEQQSGVMRETTLIPTPVGLDRSQTVRFSQPFVNVPTMTPVPRLCVAEGFFCGFDLIMPSRPFPEPTDLADCPITLSLPAVLAPFRNKTDENGRLIATELGCLIQRPDNARDWSEWIFEHGFLAMGVGDPPGKERLVAAWVQDNLNGHRVLHMHWQLPGQPHNWYNVHAYNTNVSTSSGDAPGGSVALQTSGDPNNSSTYFEFGDVQFSLDEVNDSVWSLIGEGCDPTHFIWFRTGHECHANLLPKVTVNVAVPPKQPFSCGAQQSTVPNPLVPLGTPGEGVVLEVGSSCSSTTYGFFIYIWTHGCNNLCPGDANNYGFAVVAPSRGWTRQDFAVMVEQSRVAWVASRGHLMRPNDTPSMSVPISPPVMGSLQSDGSTKWTATGMPDSHQVTFRWMATDPNGASSDPNQANILGDTGAPTVFGLLTGPPESWPTALGHKFSPRCSDRTRRITS